MIVHGLEDLEDFWQNHADARSPLNSWLQVMQSNVYRSFTELKAAFGSADYATPYTIFNIGGNKYRLIAILDYDAQIALIRLILTHAEYNKWNKKRR